MRVSWIIDRWRQETAQFLLWSYKTRKTSTRLVDQDKFNKAIAYAISKATSVIPVHRTSTNPPMKTG